METQTMDAATRTMVRAWLRTDGGDVERCARWMRDSVRIGSIGECRRLIAEAQQD